MKKIAEINSISKVKSILEERILQPIPNTDIIKTTSPERIIFEEKLSPEMSFDKNDKVISHYLDEIKSMRDEINWRVKMAYTGSLVFLTAIIVPLSSFFQKDSTILNELKSNQDTLTIVCMIALLAISAWAGVQNANHLVEKRIELYSLELMKIVKNISGHPYNSWLGFLYGNSFFKSKFKTSVAKTLNASVGFFIYFLPNLVAFFIWGFLINYGCVQNYRIWFSVVTFFVIVAASTTLMFFFYVHKVNSMFTIFYKEEMKDFFINNEIELKSKIGTLKG
jgi:hypothetical protein